MQGDTPPPPWLLPAWLSTPSPSRPHQPPALGFCVAGKLWWAGPAWQPCLPHPPTQAAPPLTCGVGATLAPPPPPPAVLVCRVSLPTLGDTPTPHALPGQLVPARPYPRARVSALLGALEGPGKLQGVWGQESPRWVRSGPRRKGAAGVPEVEGHQMGGLGEPRR